MELHTDASRTASRDLRQAAYLRQVARGDARGARSGQLHRRQQARRRRHRRGRAGARLACTARVHLQNTGVTGCLLFACSGTLHVTTDHAE